MANFISLGILIKALPGNSTAGRPVSRIGRAKIVFLIIVVTSKHHDYNQQCYTASIWLKAIAICVLIGLLGTSKGVAQFADSFSDGDFTDNPTWTGTSTKFVVEGERLRLQAPPLTDIAYLATTSEAMNNAVWEFSVQLNFNPSSSNFARVYLASSQNDLSGSLNGYFVLIGDTPDEVSLYRQTGTTRTKIIDGLDGRVNADPVIIRVRVTRDDLGNWELFSDAGLTGTFTLEGIVNDGSHPASSYTGVFCSYTSTRSSHFYFDDFMVSGSPHVPPPPANYKDLIITELFPDPNPVIGLPEAEFVELFNRSESAVNLLGWRLADPSSTATLPNYVLSPGAYVVITTSSAASAFVPFGATLGVTNFPTLNNTGDNITLRDPTLKIVDEVNYTDGWYKNDDKKQGGWTLELIDIENICAEEENWVASEHPSGGTPGQQNSVKANKPDLTGPKLLSAIPVTSTQVKLRFDEKLEAEPPPPESFTIMPALPVVAVSFTATTLREILLELGEPVQPQVTYSITASGVYDCSGNLIQTSFNSVAFGFPEPAEPLDLVINEILFNPKPFGVDFVEIVNRSRKFINLNNFSIGNFENVASINLKPITTDDLLLPPSGIIAFTTDPFTVLSHYPKAQNGSMVKVSSLPSFPDNEGSVSVVNGSGITLDHFLYSRNYHSAFLSDKEGVSLERIHANEASNDPNNWKSAASVVGFATPGLPNSNSINTKAIRGEINVEPELFIPLLGQPDFTEIRYSFEQGGKVANIKILDQQGREVKRIANNETLATDGFYRWDGDRDDGTRTPRLLCSVV
ncbi:lamin tail domain-containing protein [Oscillatoria amoena NRMC-F 0135]|nr:lamin tail domain-containing protein [Oscillatoria amoena NRMC-F 0135]